MMIQRAGMWVAITVGTACLVVFYCESAQAQVRLEYKFPEGKRLTYKTTSRVRQVLTFMNNMEKESVMRETKVWTQSVGKHRPDSTFPIEEKVELLRVEYTFPGGMKLTLDSSDPKLKIDDPDLRFLGDVFKLESAFNYAVVLDEKAKVKAIEGTEQLKEKATKLDSPIASEEFQEEIRSDRLAAKFEQAIHHFPDVPARTGEPWERTELLEINGKTFTIRKKYEYRGTEKKGDKTLEKVTWKVFEVKYDPNSKETLPVKIVKSDLKVESSEGTILFDREEGHMISTSDRIRLKGNATYSAGGVDQNAPFDLNFDTNTQLQSAKK
jgi:Family of unknown function (DUF6263)